MNTAYSEVFEISLALMESYKIDIVYDQNGTYGIISLLMPYLKIASGELENNGTCIDLSGRNDELLEFDKKLSDGTQLIIAKYICIGYLTKETFNIMQMQLHLQDGDFKTYAEKNNLDGKLNALYLLKEDVGYDIKKSGYNNFEW